MARGVQANGVVFACMLARLLLFSEARFQFRRLRVNGRPGDLFGTADWICSRRRGRTARPATCWPGRSSDADLAGNFYALRRAGTRSAASARLGHDHHRLDATRCDIVDPRAFGYLYAPRRAAGVRNMSRLLSCRTRSRTSRRSPTRSRSTAGCRG